MAPVTTKIGPITSHLPPEVDQFDELQSWMLGGDEPPRRILDVGGGGSFYDFAGRIRRHAEWMVGVDPASTVLNRPWLDEAYAATVEQFAETTPERFDAAMCLYVAEHVEQPLEFLVAVRSLLNDGAACYGITPNLWHYFGLASAGASRVGLEDWLLHRVRAADLIEAYHAPVRYRLNTIRSLSRTAAAAGFRTVEVRGLEQPGMFETYFPTRLRGFPRYYSRVVNRFASPRLCGTLVFRLGT